MNKNCLQCKKSFIPHRESKGIFCSLPCYHKNMIGKIGNIKYRKTFIAWNKGKKMPEISGENNYQWKGVKVSYRTLHKWVEKLLGKPHKCDDCGNDSLRHRQYHWSNVSGNYKRELTDWRRLCAKCHKAYDRASLALQ